MLIARVPPVFSLLAPRDPGAALRQSVLTQRGQATSQAPARPTAATQTFDAALSQAATLTRLRSLLVTVDGTLVLERYYRGASAARPANVKSVSKSIIALLVGIAVDRRQIASISDPISRYLPASSGATGDKGAITIEQLLTMRAGLETTSNRNYGRWVQSPNWVRHILQRPFVDVPGGRMIYSTGSSHLLSAVLTRATGLSTLEFARRHLGGPIGVPIRAWTRDPQGIYMGGNEMSFTARELVTIGELVRNGGRHAGRTVISDGWLRDSAVARVRSEREFDRSYGYGWWLRRMAGHDVIYAWGYGGQFVFVVPGLSATIVATSVPEPGDERREQRDAIYTIVEDHILSVLSATRQSAAGR